MGDAEAEVRIAVSDDVTGLVTEAETSDRLVRKLRILIPELLEANGLTTAQSLYMLYETLSDETQEIFLQELFAKQGDKIKISAYCSAYKKAEKEKNRSYTRRDFIYEP